MNIECAYCHRSFPIVASRVGKTRFCSRACKGAEKQNQIYHNCIACGKSFSAKASNAQKYCSPACFYQDRTAALRPLSLDEQAIMEQYEQLVAPIARRLHIEFNPRSMEYEDFYQEGMIGLINAIQQDDEPERKDEFPGFAKFHIKMAIIFAYRTQEHAIRLPESLFRRDANVTSDQLLQFKVISNCASLEALPSEGQQKHQSTSLEGRLIKTEQYTLLYHSIRQLPAQQRQYIAEHYGLIGEETAMLQLCYKYNIPRATMHRLVHRGLDTLKERLEA